MTGNPIPQLGFGSELADGSGTFLLDKLDGLSTDLGFAEYTEGTKSLVDVFAITLGFDGGYSRPASCDCTFLYRQARQGRS